MKGTFFGAAALSVVAASVWLAGCSTAPKSEEGKANLHEAVESTLERLKVKYEGFEDVLDDAHGYAVFPTVGKGGFVVGGAYGRGEVYREGDMIGYADISKGSVGLQAGGQSFAEVIVFEDERALRDFTDGEFALAADLSAVILKSGEAVSARYDDGVAVFVEPQGGAMFEASIGGQSLNYQPK